MGNACCSDGGQTKDTEHQMHYDSKGRPKNQGQDNKMFNLSASA